MQITFVADVTEPTAQSGTFGEIKDVPEPVAAHLVHEGYAINGAWDITPHVAGATAPVPVPAP